MKRCLAVCLSVLLMLTALPLGAVSVYAADSGWVGDCAWTLDDDGHLTISGNGAIPDFDYPWGQDIVSVTIEDGVTAIGEYAFYGCGSLVSVMVPDSVTYIAPSAFLESAYYNDPTNWEDGVLYIGRHLITTDGTVSGSYEIKEGTLTIGSGAFYYSSELTAITLPDSIVAIGDYAFHGCGFLTSVNIPYGVTVIEADTFAYCSALTSIVIPDSVTAIGSGAFYNCEALDSVTVPDSVTTIDSGAFNNTAYSNNPANRDNGVLYAGRHLLEADTAISGSYTVKEGTLTISDSAFFDCESLTAVVIPDSVTKIGWYAFRGCKSLTSVKLSNRITTLEDSLFDYCTSLEEITIPDSVTTIESFVFSNCSSLKTITIPDSVTEVSSYAFWDSTNLETVYVGAGVTQSLESMFGDSDKLVSVTVSENNPNYATQDGVLYSKDMTMLWILPAAWSGTFTLPATVSYISEYTALKQCNAVTAFEVDADNQWYMAEDGVLFDIYQTRLIRYPGARSGGYTVPNGVMNIGDYAFKGCAFLTDITVSPSASFLTADLFSGCTALENIHVRQGSGEYRSVDGIVYAGDTLVLCPLGRREISVIPENVSTIGEAAFRGCAYLSSITIPESITAIDRAAFSGCSALTSITIPEGITVIEDDTFSSCSALTSITIPDNVTTIGHQAFSGCNSLVDVFFGNGITYVGMGAFPSTVESVYITDLTAWCNIEFYGYVDPTMDYLMGANPLEYGGNLYLNGDLITDLVIPDGITTVRGNSFSGGTFTSVTFPESVTYVDEAAFMYCSRLTEVTIPGHITTVGPWAFAFCSRLSNVILEEGVTTLKTGAFMGQGSIDTVVLPRSLRSIGYAAFTDYAWETQMEGVYYTGSEEDRQLIEDGGWNEFLFDAPWHYNWCNHTYDDACDVDCNQCQEERVPPHVYDDRFDADCNLCGAVRDVVTVIFGDANGDENVNIKDLGLLQQYLNGWNVDVVAEAIDVNGDGNVNIKDLGLLQQYLNGWDVALGTPI